MANQSYIKGVSVRVDVPNSNLYYYYSNENYYIKSKIDDSSFFRVVYPLNFRERFSYINRYYCVEDKVMEIFLQKIIRKANALKTKLKTG